jgi:F0F1-type ATP synthase membrane subunit a
MRAFGRLLQLVGLLVPPLSIMLQLRGTIKANTMLVMLVASVSLFYIGRLIEGYSSR